MNHCLSWGFSYKEICQRSVERCCMALLRKPNVVPWLYNKLDFLFPEGMTRVKRKERFERESRWGRELVGRGVSERSHWTGPFGESVGYDLITHWHGSAWKPRTVDRWKLDWETDHVLLEIKTGSYFVKGSIDDKVLGIPFKYLDVPQLYGKPLWILCVGRTEHASRNLYGNLQGPRQTEAHRELLMFWEERGIRFVGATELIVYSNAIERGRLRTESSQM